MEIIDKIFAESIRKAIQDFGTDIILDRRLIGILKDYQGFRQLAPAEFITRILIETGTIRRVHALKSQDHYDIDDFLNREISSLERQYGFADKYTRTTLCSILNALEIGFTSEKANSDRETLPEKTTVAKSEVELTMNTKKATYKATSNHNEPEDEEDEEIDKPSFQEVRNTLKKIISTKYGIPRRDIENDNTLEELEDISVDAIDVDELIEEIEDKFDVFLDEDLIDEFMTINELSREIMDMMDD